MPFMDLGPCLCILVGGERKVGGVEAPCARATATDKHWEFKIFSTNFQTIFSHFWELHPVYFISAIFLQQLMTQP